MDLARLRDILKPLIYSLKDSCTHASLPSECEALGLPIPDAEGSKAERVGSILSALQDVDLPNAARKFLEKHTLRPSSRNAIQDVLWEDSGCPDIPKRLRRELARALAVEDLFAAPNKFDELLGQLWDLQEDPLAEFLSGKKTGLQAEITRHIHRNPGDWSVEVLFDKLGVYSASNRRVALFLEGLASGDVQLDREAQLRLVGIVNTALRDCGVRLQESGIDGGYPVFRLVAIHAAANGRPKNLIFASSVKPDIRFRDAVNNDIEIVNNADKVLVYDKPISLEGLSWSDLQTWWSDAEKIANPENAKRSLYQRLRSSLPANSPPQALLFDAFYRGFASSVPRLPALLPEVWLHWDPLTVKERGPDALLRFRMDFLLLFPQGVRVVIEVDGKQHYADLDGRANATRYAKMVKSDRHLKLAGYQVFRFGAAELASDTDKVKVKAFFEALFKRYGVAV